MLRNSDFFFLEAGKEGVFWGRTVCFMGRASMPKKHPGFWILAPVFAMHWLQHWPQFPDVYFLQILILEGNMNTNVTLRLVGISLKRQNYPPIHIEEGCNLFRLNSLYLQTVMSIGLRSHICHVSWIYLKIYLAWETPAKLILISQLVSWLAGW